ncbi:hypothetical protein PPYR_12753 [Photinus pyralis]|uniref:Uncharacterized protein n=1 Tax=Photinus pyralis TaxID=7054 RepID=A0A5N4A742_PHOPY|nr:hypothetical protein PPYR_12753 [Photinus pyralis]
MKTKGRHSRDDYPRRTFVPGARGGLTIDSLYTNKNHIDPLCEGSIQGYKVALHHPSEMPNMDRCFLLPLDQVVFVGIKPSLISVSPELVNYAPRVRNCYFTHERYLASYKGYTQQNCMEECLANYTMKRCKCIPFFFPPLHDKINICGPGSSECVREMKYLEVEPCECLPSCTSVSYDVETSQTNWLWNDVLEASHPLERLIYNELLKDVYYKDAQFLTCERKELHGLVDFFSNVGGLFGLFIGFSVTSVFEILYFLTLRIICNIKKYGKDAWSGDPCVISKQPLIK